MGAQMRALTMKTMRTRMRTMMTKRRRRSGTRRHPLAVALRKELLKVNIPTSSGFRSLRIIHWVHFRVFNEGKDFLVLKQSHLFIFHHSTFVFISSRHHSHFCDKLYLFVRKQTNKWHFVKIPNNSCLFV